MGKWARTALRMAKPEASKSLPVGDFGVVESVQCVELEGGGAGAEENDGGWGGVGKCGQSQEDLFVLYVEDAGVPVKRSAAWATGISISLSTGVWSR